MIYLNPKKIDEKGKVESIEVYINSRLAQEYGIKNGDLLNLFFPSFEIGVIAILTDTIVTEREIGIPEIMWGNYPISQKDYVAVEILGQAQSVEYIREKILGKTLGYKEIYQIIDDITHRRLSPIEMTYFAASSYNPGFNKDEVYYITKAMAETGEMLKFNNLSDIVVDKHSIGGLPSKGVTPVLVSLIASLGLIIPNTSSRAITSPAGTSDILEVVMPVALDKQAIKETVKATNGCMVWGGGLHLAPADDILIQIEKPLHIESYDKFVASIMAKKVATGVTHQLIDLPFGKYAKVPKEDVDKVSNMFVELGERFGIKVKVYARESYGVDGNGIGPVLEIRDVLYILERHKDRPVALENLALDMASELAALSGKYTYQQAFYKLRKILDDGTALEKFWEIAKVQGATQVVKTDSLKLGEFVADIKINKSGIIKGFDNSKVVQITRALGTPTAKKAGIYLHYFVDDKISAGDVIATLYAQSDTRLKLALKVIDKLKDSWVIIN